MNFLFCCMHWPPVADLSQLSYGKNTSMNYSLEAKSTVGKLLHAISTNMTLAACVMLEKTKAKHKRNKISHMQNMTCACLDKFFKKLRMFQFHYAVRRFGCFGWNCIQEIVKILVTDVFLKRVIFTTKDISNNNSCRK